MFRGLYLCYVFSAILLSCSITTGTLGSPGLLPLCFIITISLNITIILIITPKSINQQSTGIGKSTHALQEIDIRAGPTTKNASRPLSAPKASAESLPAVDNSNLLEVARKYKTRLVAAEEILEQLRAENQRLKVSGGGKLPTPKGVNNGDINDENARDANWRLQQLQVSLGLGSYFSILLTSYAMRSAALEIH